MVRFMKERLTDSGFKVEVRKFNEDIDNEFGFNIDETILICKK